MSNCPVLGVQSHHSHTHCLGASVSHREMFLLLDNAAHYFVAHNTDQAGSTGPADNSVRVLY